MSRIQGQGLHSTRPVERSNTVTAEFQRASALHRHGNIPDAEDLYAEILRRDPTHFEALYSLGVAALQTGRVQRSVEIISRAIALNGNIAAAHINFGYALNIMGQSENAIASYERAIALNPDYAEAYNNRGSALFALKRHDEAIASFSKAVLLKPDYVAAYNNLGNAFRELKSYEQALENFETAIALMPKYAEAYNNRGNALSDLERYEHALASYDKAVALNSTLVKVYNNRAAALANLKRHAEALANYDTAVKLNSGYAEAYHNRGNLLSELKQHHEALASYNKALKLKPDSAEAYANRAKVLNKLKRYEDALVSCSRAIALTPAIAGIHVLRGIVLCKLQLNEEALASYNRAIALEPDHAEAYCDRGIVLNDLGLPQEALASYDRAITLSPAYAEAYSARGIVLNNFKRQEEALASYDRAISVKQHYADALMNRALCRLLVGRYPEGFADFEWRWETSTFSAQRPKFPTLQTTNVGNNRVLVFSEQGLGDIIQFVRYLPLLARTGCELTFLTRPKLMRLLQPLTSGFEVVGSLTNQRQFDFQCALMSLPHLFGSDVESIPNSIPYLRAEPEMITRWRHRIGEGGFKIGIAWQGNPQGKIDQGRSIPLVHYLALARIEGVRLISLQKGFGAEQINELQNQAAVESLGDDFDSGPDAFIDTAAVMSVVDLVITSDTAIAHLAGALACPTWVPLKYVPAWQWMLDREDNPWYPTLRLFRQTRPDDWSSVFANIADELKAILIRFDGDKRRSA